jgi:hypothetical protein
MCEQAAPLQAGHLGPACLKSRARIFTSAALAMNTERVSPCAAASSSIAYSVPASIETLALADRPVSRTTLSGPPRA